MTPQLVEICLSTGFFLSKALTLGTLFDKRSQSVSPVLSSRTVSNMPSTLSLERFPAFGEGLRKIRGEQSSILTHP